MEHEGHCKSTAIDLRRFVSADLRTYLRAIETRDPAAIEDDDLEDGAVPNRKKDPDGLECILASTI